MVRTSNGRRAEPSPPGAGVQCGSLPGILVVCGVRLYRDGLVDLLEAGDGVTVTGTAATCDEALACCREAPAAALVDVPSAAAAPVAARLRGRWPETKLIALGLYEDPDVVLAYVEAGFDGYVTRTTSLTGLNKTIRRVLDGEAVCSPKIAAALFRRLRAGNPTSHRLSLTPRELEVAELINEGLSNQQIASLLSIETATVKSHVHNILEKLQVERRGEAALALRRTGLLERF